MQQFYSHGKLLITGEYLVLDGATSLALPTKYGQFLEVYKSIENKIIWKSYNINKECWFKTELDINDLSIINSYGNDKIAKTLQEILRTAKSLNPNFLNNNEGLEVKTKLTFPNNWGLGTSSTLINNIAQWSKINAFELLEKSFGGSGYDIACAQNNKPITYKRNGINPFINLVEFKPTFREQLFFVYLNEKQDSKEGIKMYRSLLSVNKQDYIKKVNTLTTNIIEATSITEFSDLLTQHEKLLSSIIKIIPVKEKLFPDFKGAIKSLGAWGGDFVLVTGTEKYVRDYFVDKGYQTIINYNDMIL